MNSLWRHSMIASSWNYLVDGSKSFFTGISKNQKYSLKNIIQSRIGSPHSLGTWVHNIHVVQCIAVRIRLWLHERSWRVFFFRDFRSQMKYPKKNTVAALKSNMLVLPNFLARKKCWASHATESLYCCITCQRRLRSAVTCAKAHWLS